MNVCLDGNIENTRERVYIDMKPKAPEIGKSGRIYPQ